VIPEPARRPATGYGLRADELGQQMLMGGVAAAAIALIIVLLIVAGFVIAGVLSQRS
jgi:ABC-type dipeptide/oligopeptide/nickel transport system permease subunit